MSISGISSASTASLWDELLQKNGKAGEAQQNESILNLAGQSEENEETVATESSSQVFDSMDSNQDGVVSAEELAKALELLRAAQGTLTGMVGQEAEPGMPRPPIKSGQGTSPADAARAYERADAETSANDAGLSV